MAFLDKIRSFFGQRASLNNPDTSIAEGLAALSGEGVGTIVNADTTFALTTFFRAVSILSGVIASMDLSVYAISDDETRQKNRQHPVSLLLKRGPNPYITSYDFVQIMVAHIVAFGNFYARIDRNNQARPVALTILDAENVQVVSSGRRSIVYVYRNENNEEVRYPYDRIVHISGLSNGSVQGLKIIDLFKSVIGAGLSNQEFIRFFFQNGAQLSGVVSVPDKLTQEAYDRMTKSWREAYSGPRRAGATAILEAGASYQKIGLTPTDAGFSDTRKAITADIARITGVPQFLLEELDRSTFNNIEHLGQLFVSYTIMPLCANIEAEFSKKLLLESEFMTNEIRFDLSFLLRADTAGRANLIDTMMKWGVVNRDEARKMEGMAPISDGSGKAYYIPINMRDPVTEPIQQAQQSNGAQNTPQNEN